MKKNLLFIMLLVCINSVKAQIVITEILYNAASSEATNETQFVEIANTTNAALDLSDYEIGDSQDNEWNTLPSVTLPAFGVAVICGSSAADFTTAFGALPVGVVLVSIADNSETMFNLSNSPSATNETVAIRLASGLTIIDEVNYDDGGDWPGDPGGISIYLNRTTAQIIASGTTDNDDGTNWSASSNGTHGAFVSVVGGVWNNPETSSPGLVGSGAVSLLPVEFSYFSAKLNNSEVSLEWATATELENDYFRVERSLDGKSFVELAKVQGAGTTVEAQTYSYVDAAPKAGVNYYRLKQVDFDSTYEYSDIVTVNTDKNAEIEVFPVPTAEVLTIQSTREISEVQVMDITGKVVLVQQFDAATQLDLNVARLVAGSYFVAIQSERGVEMIRFVKQ